MSGEDQGRELSSSWVFRSQVEDVYSESYSVSPKRMKVTETSIGEGLKAG